MKILVVEDEKELREAIVSYLEGSGFLCEASADFWSAEDKILSFEYDVILLDITLPDGNGLDLLPIIRENYPETGVLIVSAKNSLDDKLKGLDDGADDYITKPFHLAELNSRINALIRRKKFHGQEIVAFNEIEITPQSQSVTVSGKTVDLTPKEYELLLFFMTNKNRVITRQGLAEHIWGDQVDVVDDIDFIYTHIRNLRKKITEAGGKDYIATVYGIGYKFSEG